MTFRVARSVEVVEWSTASIFHREQLRPSLAKLGRFTVKNTRWFEQVNGPDAPVVAELSLRR